MARVRKFEPKAKEDASTFPVVGTCPMDGTVVRETPSGPACEEGHGGVELIPLPTFPPEEPAPNVSAKDVRAAVSGIFGPRRESTPEAAELVNELEKADKKRDDAAGRGVLFDSVNRAAEVPIDPRYGALVATATAAIDWVAAQDEFEAWLRLGDRRIEEAFVRKAHEEGPGIIRRLGDVYFQVRLAREEWEAANDVVFGAMREQASVALEDEKARGARKKAITEADVRARAASMFSDEWPRQESLRRRHKLVEDRAKHDLEVAGIRQRTLDTMVSRLR